MPAQRTDMSDLSASNACDEHVIAHQHVCIRARRLGISLCAQTRRGRRASARRTRILCARSLAAAWAPRLGLYGPTFRSVCVCVWLFDCVSAV